MVNTEFKIKNKTFKNPIWTASGTYGYNSEFNDFLDVSRLGAVCTKAITLNPRSGNDWSRLAEVKGGIINSIGLENVGVQRFLKEKLPVLKSQNIDFVVNTAGSSEEEYLELAKIFEENKIDAIELNVSCPNVKSGCLEFGSDKGSLYKLVSKVRELYTGCLIVKLTPNVTRIEELALAAQSAGADAISAINTLKGLKIELEFRNGKFIQKRTRGGFSGQAIKPVALGVVERLSNTVDIPIIGIGGISSFEDMLEFFAAGASAIQIGTHNFTQPDIAEEILNKLEKFMEENNFKTLKELQNALREQ